MKPPLNLLRRLLHTDYQIDYFLIMWALTDAFDTANLLCTPSIHSNSFTFVFWNMLTAQLAYYKMLPQDYIDDLTTFTRNMYTLVADEYHPQLLATTATKQLKHVEHFIIRDLQDFLPQIQGFTKVRAIPPRGDPTSGSRTEHAQRKGAKH